MEAGQRGAARHGLPRVAAGSRPGWTHRVAAAAATPFQPHDSIPGRATESDGPGDRHHSARGGAACTAAAGVPLRAAYPARAAVQRPARAVSLPRLQTASRGAREIVGLPGTATTSLFCVVLVGTLSGLPGPLPRLVGRSPAQEHPPAGLQLKIFAATLGGDSLFGLAPSGAHDRNALRGVGARLRSSDLLCGNLHCSGALPRDL